MCKACPFGPNNVKWINVAPAAATLLSTSADEMCCASPFVKFALNRSYLHKRKEDGDSGACGADMTKTVEMIWDPGVTAGSVRGAEENRSAFPLVTAQSTGNDPG